MSTGEAPRGAPTIWASCAALCTTLQCVRPTARVCSTPWHRVVPSCAVNCLLPDYSCCMLDEAGDGVHAVGNSSATSTRVAWSGYVDTCSGMRCFVVTPRCTWPAHRYGRPMSWMPLGAPTSETLLPASIVANVPDASVVDVTVHGTTTSHSGLMANASVSLTVDRTGPEFDGIFNTDGRLVSCQSSIAVGLKPTRPAKPVSPSLSAARFSLPTCVCLSPTPLQLASRFTSRGSPCSHC